MKADPQVRAAPTKTLPPPLHYAKLRLFSSHPALPPHASAHILNRPAGRKADDNEPEMSTTKGKNPAGKPQRSAIADVVAREYTIHMHKRVRPLCSIRRGGSGRRAQELGITNGR